MTAEEFAELIWGRKVEEWERGEMVYDFHDLTGFAEQYHQHRQQEQEQKRKSDPMKRII